MIYHITVANGEVETNIEVTEVDTVILYEGVYMLRDKNQKLLFSAPIDSVVYLEVG